MNNKEKSKAAIRKREITKSVIWIMLPITITLGWIYPVAGLFILVCMSAGVLIAIFKGRLWCGWFCPRGIFLEKFFTNLNPHKDKEYSNKLIAKAYKKIKSSKISAYNIFKTTAFRISFLIFMMSMMTFQVYRGWPDVEKIGTSFVLLLTVATVIAFVLGVLVHPRAWCAFCPIGTMSSWVANKNHYLKINPETCIDCKLCYKVCPVKIDPTKYKDTGKITHKDCFKCEACLRHCPTNAIYK